MEEKAHNTAELKSLTYLEKRAKTIFGPTPTEETSIPALDAADAVISHETSSLLRKRVIGKADVDIAAMIQRLGNSDWVRNGRAFYEVNNKQCPFCQWNTTDEFARSLNEYFDDTFEKDTKAIEELETSYMTDARRLQLQLEAILGAPSKFLDVEKLKAEKAVIDSKVSLNIQRLSAKRKEPSQTVQMDSLAGVIDAVRGFIDTANAKISDHNKVVANFEQEKKDLTSQVWKYLVEAELMADHKAYEAKRNGLNKAIESISTKIALAKTEKAAKETEIKLLEKEVTSVQPTIDAINGLLSDFGFRGFLLAKADSGTCYKLVRLDGTDAKETLSEGEKTFVTFLYFYHLVKGSDSESGITTDRVVVFDDPVSSLDSDILFIVGTLIKGLFEEVRSARGHIKQIFILTHNVYFHKEVTFNPKRSNNQAMKEETFWLVRKPGLESKIEKQHSDPIKTSYELLWAEVRRSDRSSLTIQNTLRRILENYFRILGGVDPDKICAKFEGRERLICKSLFSWVNDGSHSAHDDLYVSVDDSLIKIYLGVFRAIFEKTDHHAHYKMMMAGAYIDAPSDVPMV